MRQEIKTAVIMAAGPETISYNDPKPRCLVSSDGVSLLEHEIRILKSCGIEKIVIVVGGKGTCWHEDTYDEIRQIHDSIIINYENLNTKNAFSLFLGLDSIERQPTLIMDGDIILRKAQIISLLNCKYKNALLSREAISSSEFGTKICFDNDRIIDIGLDLDPEEFPWFIWSGIMKIGNNVFNVLKSVAKKDSSKNKYIGEILKLIIKNNKIYNLDMGKLDAISSPIFGGSHATIKRLEIIRKEANDDGRQKVIEEVNWLRGLPVDVRKHFPIVKNFDLDSKLVFFEMPYYRYPSFRKALLSGELDNCEALSILKNISNFMFNSVYTKRHRPAPVDYIKTIHLNKIWQRLKITKQRAKVFKDIFDADTVIINGIKSKNIFELTNYIENKPDLLEILNPPKLCMVHGDLHFDNIIIDIKTKDFILLDPRGLDNYWLTYDLGKIWHSFYGFYDLLHQGMFDLDFKVKDGTVNANLVMSKTPALKQYKMLHREFPKTLEKHNLLKEDPHWMLRTLFSNASHFCSVMPFHLKNDGKEHNAIAMYLMGLKLLTEFIDIYENKFEMEEFFPQD